MPSGRAFAKRCLVIAGIVSLLAIATLPLLAAPPAAGGLWTQTTETGFLRGTWSNVEVLPGGDIQLSSNKTWSKEGLVMDLGPPSSPDNSGARAASVMKDGTTYRMWYTGYDGARLRGLYATSSDGLIWTRRGVAINVLTAPYNFDLIAGTSVIKEGSTYRMWFSGGYWGGGPFGELWARIYYAESTDAVSWTIRGVAFDLSPPGSWDDHGLELPSVAHVGTGLYYLYYIGWTGGPVVRTGVATSTDGLTFSRPINTPFVDTGTPGGWESVSTGTAATLPGTPFRTWYTGTDGPRARLGLATSPDGIRATKFPLNPVLTEGPPGALDDVGVTEPALLVNGTNVLLYHTMLDGVALRIGLARETQSFASTGWYDSAVFDSGSDGTTWTMLNANGTVDPSSVLVLRTRSGNVPTPDASWSPLSPQATIGVSSITSPRSRFLQVHVEFATANPATSPVLHEFSV